MAGLLSKVFEAAEDQTSPAVARGEALADWVPDREEDETGSPAGAEQPTDSSTGTDQRSDADEAESREEQSSSGETSASAEAEADLELTIENETEVSYTDANGETRSHSNELTIGTDQEFEVGFTFGSSSAEDMDSGLGG